VALHECLGEIFTSLQYGTLFGRADDRDVFQLVVVLEEIIYSFDQGIFRTDYHHVHAFAEDKLPDAFKIIGFERYVFPHTARTRISGCDVQLVYFLALGDFPGQSVFAPSAA
jgi:hypothetical protein